MLIEFNVENFLSFKDLTTFSMVGAKSFKEHQDTHTAEVDKLTLLKSAIIYGNNASGKSNLLKAMSFMKDVVLSSLENALLHRKFPLQKFALNTKSEEEPSFFEVSFIYQGIKYRYGFEIEYDRIVAEWLYHTTSREVYLFKRDFQKIEVNKSAFKEGWKKETDVKENVLFLSLLATFGKKISSDIVHWFNEFNFIISINDSGYKDYTMNRMKTDKNFHAWVVTFIKCLEISHIETKEVDIVGFGVEFTIGEGSNAKQMEPTKSKINQLITYHRKYDNNNVLIDTVAFDLDRQESEGTKKLLYLLGPIYDTLQNGKVLLIDELDSRLHNRLTQLLLDFFHQYNTKNAQLICAVHDVSLLNKKTFRRDQIWFVEKNQFGASELVSLADFKTDKVRNKSDFSKNYVEGKYGAIPYFETDYTLN